MVSNGDVLRRFAASHLDNRDVLDGERARLVRPNRATLNQALLRDALGSSTCHQCGTDLGLRAVREGESIPMTHVIDGRCLCTHCVQNR